MAEYINKSDEIAIIDDLWNRVGNNSRDFYLRLRKAIYDLHTEEIIHCKYCKHYCNVLYEGTQFEYGECSKSPFSRIFSNITGPDDFCSSARLKDEY